MAIACRMAARETRRSTASCRSVGSRVPAPAPFRSDSARMSAASAVRCVTEPWVAGLSVIELSSAIPQTNLTNRLCDIDSRTNHTDCHALTSPEAQAYDAANQSVVNQSASVLTNGLGSGPGAAYSEAGPRHASKEA